MSTSADQSAGPQRPGTQAPNFELPASPDASVSLDDVRRQPVILALYLMDWSPVCSAQMALYQKEVPGLTRFETAGVVDAIGGELRGSIVGRNHS